MSNIVITNVDLGSVALGGEQFRDETLRFAGADTFVEGTILARRRVAIAVTASAVTGTGNGTVTGATVVEGPIVPLVGAYVLTCVTVVTHGGIFKLVDPNGAIVGSDIKMTAGSGVATIVEIAGLRFTITDGSTDFIAGDFFTLTTAADGTLVPYNPAGAAGEQLPLAVLTYAVSKTGAGTEPVRALVAGTVNRNRLIIDADGDGDDITDEALDQLRSAGVVAVDVQQHATLDNQ